MQSALLLSQRLLLMLLVLLVRWSLAEHDSKFCELTPPGQSALPPTPQAYTIHLTSRREGIPARGSSVEYFDSVRQKLSVLATMAGSDYRIVVDFANNQAQLINLTNPRDLLGACEVQPVNANEFMASVDFKGNQIGLPSRLFFFGGGSVHVASKGQTSIDGLAANQYYSCHYWEERDTSLQVNWYFSAPDNAVPIRVTVELKDNTNGLQFVLINDVSLFLSSLPEWLAQSDPFMAPPGIYCPGLSSGGRSPPVLPDRFSLRVESIHPKGGGVDYLKEAYDFKASLSLLQGRPPVASGDGAKYGAGRLLRVHDFQRDLAYISNLDMGNCTWEKIAGPDWDSQRDGDQLRLRTPREFFDLDTKHVQYKGATRTRDLPADIFIASKRIESGVPGIFYNTTVEWHFANKTVTDPVTKEKVLMPYPLSARVSSEAAWLNSRIHVYDFEQPDEEFNRHELGACFGADAKQHFWLFFPLSDRLLALARSQTRQFGSLLVLSVSLALDISPLRVLDVDIVDASSMSGGLTVELTVTEKPSVQTTIPETPLPDIRRQFELSVAQSQIFSAVQDDTELASAAATRVDVLHERSVNIKSIGYGLGAVAGAATGLLLAGLVAGLVAAFFYLR